MSLQEIISLSTVQPARLPLKRPGATPSAAALEHTSPVAAVNAYRARERGKVFTATSAGETGANGQGSASPSVVLDARGMTAVNSPYKTVHGTEVESAVSIAEISHNHIGVTANKGLARVDRADANANRNSRDSGDGFANSIGSAISSDIGEADVPKHTAQSGEECNQSSSGPLHTNGVYATGRGNSHNASGADGGGGDDNASHGIPAGPPVVSVIGHGTETGSVDMCDRAQSHSPPPLDAADSDDAADYISHRHNPFTGTGTTHAAPMDATPAPSGTAQVPATPPATTPARTGSGSASKKAGGRRRPKRTPLKNASADDDSWLFGLGLRQDFISQPKSTEHDVFGDAPPSEEEVALQRARDEAAAVAATVASSSDEDEEEEKEPYIR